MDARQAAQSYEPQTGPATTPGPATPGTIPTEEGESEKDGFLDKEVAGQSLVDQGIGIMVAVIVIGAVAIPVASQVINDVNVTGTTATVLGFVPLALGVGLFVAAISIVR